MKRRAIIGREVGRSTTLYLQLQKIYPQYHVECLPTIITQEVPFTLPHIGVGKSPVLLFTSPRAVEHFYRHHQEWANSIEAVAIGEGTSRALYAAGVHPSFISSEESARGMAPQLLAFLQSILLQRAIIQPTSNIAGDFLQQYFNERGVEYHKLITYQVTPHPELKNYTYTLQEEPAFIVFYSPSGVRAWSQASAFRPPAISIGPVTTEELKQQAWPTFFESRTPSPEELLATITKNIRE